VRTDRSANPVATAVHPLTGEFIGAPPQEDGVHRVVDLREIPRGVVDDPIQLAARSRDVPVKAG
jgi:hypothetical protein